MENVNTENLRAALTALSPERFQQIRNAYYQAVEGINQLADELDEATEVLKGLEHEQAPALSAEHHKANLACRAVARIKLGAVV